MDMPSPTEISLPSKTSFAPHARKIRMLQDLCRKYDESSIEDYLHFGQMLLLIIRESDISPEICDLCNVVSNKLLDNDNILKALTYAKDALAFSEKIGYPQGLARSYSNISTVQSVLNNYQDALDAEFNSLRVNEHLNDKNEISDNYFKIGVINSKNKNYDRALGFFQKSLQLKSDLDDHKGIITIYKNLSKIYLQIDNMTEAAKYGEMVLSICQQHNDEAGISFASENLGTIYQKMGAVHKAIEFHKKSLVINEQIGDKLMIGNSLSNIGRCYLKTNNFDYAISNFLKASDILKDIVNDEIICDLSFQLAKCYSHNKDYVKAFEYQKIYSDLRNQILIKDNDEKLSALRTTLEVEKKDMNSEISHLKNVKLSKSNAINDKLFSIISHNLQNPFSSLQTYIDLIRKSTENHEEENILKLLDDLGKSVEPANFMMRNLIMWAGMNKNEIEFKSKNLVLFDLVNEVVASLAKSFKQKKIFVENWISENLIIVSDEEIMRTILQNLLSNAIKYSFTNSKIVINMRETKDSVAVSVKDSGIGMSREKISNIFKVSSYNPQPGTADEIGSGLGLILCSELISLCRGKIEVESVIKKGSVFTIIIPNVNK